MFIFLINFPSCNRIPPRRFFELRDEVVAVFPSEVVVSVTRFYAIIFILYICAIFHFLFKFVYRPRITCQANQKEIQKVLVNRKASCMINIPALALKEQLQFAYRSASERGFSSRLGLGPASIVEDMSEVRDS